MRIFLIVGLATSHDKPKKSQKIRLGVKLLNIFIKYVPIVQPWPYLCFWPRMRVRTGISVVALAEGFAVED